MKIFHQSYRAYAPLAFTLAARGTAVVGVLIFTVIISKYFNPAEAGEIFLFVTYATGLSMVCRFGFDMLIIKDIASIDRSAHTTSLVFQYYKASALVCLVCGVFWTIYAVMVRLDFFYGAAVLVLAYATTIMFLSSSVLKAKSHPALGSLCEGSIVFLFVSAVLFSRDTLDLNDTMALVCVSSIVTSALAIVLTRKLLTRNINEQERGLHSGKTAFPITQYLTRSSPYAFMAIAAFVSQWGALILASHVSDVETVATINILLRFLAPLHFVQITVDYYLAPKIAAVENPSHTKSMRTKGSLVALTLTLPWVLIVVFAPDWLLSLLAGSEYSGASQSLQIIIVGYYLLMALGCNGIIMAMQGKQNALLKLTLIRALIVVTIGTFLIARYGYSGAAVSYLLAIAFQAIAARIIVDKS